MTNTEIMKEFRVNNREIEGICRLFRGEMQAVECISTDLSLENKVLLRLKTFDGAPCPKLIIVNAIDLYLASTICFILAFGKVKAVKKLKLSSTSIFASSSSHRLLSSFRTDFFCSNIVCTIH